MKQYWARQPLVRLCDGNDNEVDAGTRSGYVSIYLAADVDVTLAEKDALIAEKDALIQDAITWAKSAEAKLNVPVYMLKNAEVRVAALDLECGLYAARWKQEKERGEQLAAILSELVQAVENERQWAIGKLWDDEARVKPYLIAEQAKAALLAILEGRHDCL